MSGKPLFVCGVAKLKLFVEIFFYVQLLTKLNYMVWAYVGIKTINILNYFGFIRISYVKSVLNKNIKKSF